MRLFLLLFLMPLLSSAQFARIRGVAPLSAGEEIQLRVYEDPISRKERVLAKQIIEADGSFELKVHTHEVQYAFLQVGRNRADFFMERDKDLELTFVPPEEDPDKPKGFNERPFFTPKTIGGRSAGLNEQVIAFNDSLDRFLERIYPKLVQRNHPGYVGQQLAVFEESVSWHFGGVEPFVQDHIKYSIAGVEQTFLTDRKRLYGKYLKDVRPKYDNPAYVDFLLQFHQGSVYRMAVINRHDECIRALDGREAFASLMEMLIEENPEIRGSSVCSMVLINGMDELFGQKDLENGKLIKALREFGMFSSNSYLGNAARNIAAKHEMSVQGSEAPDITFTGMDGEKRKLSDFRGTYVFLELTDASNPYCMRETDVIPSLKQEFRNVRFVTICVGNTLDEMKDLHQRIDIDWDFGGIDLSDPTMDSYHIKSLPRFYILDPSGRFYRIPALEPSRGARSELLALHEMLKAKGKGSIGQ